MENYNEDFTDLFYGVKEEGNFLFYGEIGKKYFRDVALYYEKQGEDRLHVETSLVELFKYMDTEKNILGSKKFLNKLHKSLYSDFRGNVYITDLDKDDDKAIEEQIGYFASFYGDTVDNFVKAVENEIKELNVKSEETKDSGLIDLI